MLDGRVVLRMNDKDIEEALSLPPPRGGGAGRGAGRGGDDAGRGAGAEAGRGAGAAVAAAPIRSTSTTSTRPRASLALFDRGGNSDMSAGGSDLTWQTQRVDGGTVFVQSQAGGGRNADPAAGLPQVTLAVEHYNRMVRLLDRNIPVKVELNVATRFHEETAAEWLQRRLAKSGERQADEIVLIGGALRLVARRDRRHRQRRRDAPR